jgi:hypothetical protein
VCGYGVRGAVSGVGKPGVEVVGDGLGSLALSSPARGNRGGTSSSPSV